MKARRVLDTLRGYCRLARYALLPGRTGSETSSRHLLLLAWQFPPAAQHGIYRPAALARYASRRGWKVTVVCAPVREPVTEAGRIMLDYVGEKVRRCSLPDPGLQPSHRFFPRIDGGFVNALATADLVLEQLKRDPPAVVIATGPPFHNFVAARLIARSMRIPFVLDFRDEWTECPFGFVKPGNLDRHYERLCLRDADAVVFTTRSQLRHCLETFPALAESRSSVIPNGWEPGDPAEEHSDVTLKPAAFRLAFVGTLADHTLPESFLRTLHSVLDGDQRLREVARVVFVGYKSRRAQEQIDAFSSRDTLELADPVPMPAAVRLMRVVDALLVLNPPQLHRYIPGKMYEYIASGTPILVYGTGGEVEDLVKKLDAGIVIPADTPAALAEALFKLPALRDARKDGQSIDWLRAHTRERLACRMLDLLQSLATRP